MVIENKLRKCKDKRECFQVIREELEKSIFRETLTNIQLAHLLYNAILVYTSEFLDGKRNPESYSVVVDRVLGKYKECSGKPEELVLKVKDVRG